MALLKAILPIATGVIIAWSVCLSVTLVHPAEAVGWNEMPFGRDTQIIKCGLGLVS